MPGQNPRARLLVAGDPTTLAEPLRGHVQTQQFHVPMENSYVKRGPCLIFDAGKHTARDITCPRWPWAPFACKPQLPSSQRIWM